MNILHINCNYATSGLHKTMLEHFNDTDIVNTVFVPVSTSRDIKETDSCGVYIRKCFHTYDRLFYHVKQKKIYSELKQVLSPAGYDLIHAYTVFTDGGIAYKLKKEYGIPYVTAVRNTDVNAFFKYMPHLRKYGIEILKNAEKVFFLSPVYKNRIMHYIPEKDKEEFEKKCMLVPNGIDDFWFENTSDACRVPADKKLKICFAGRVDRNKNCRLTMKACERLMNEGYDIQYTMIGKLIDKKVKKQIEKKSYIQYIPPVGKEDLIKIYRDHDIFVMPSKTESFGLVYVEAMSQGLPVIYTKNEGFDGQFPEGTVGYHVSTQDAGELACAIKKVMAKHAELSQNCRKNIATFNWDAIVKTYSKQYKEIKEKSERQNGYN